jgi:hypothetical protein
MNLVAVQIQGITVVEEATRILTTIVVVQLMKMMKLQEPLNFLNRLPKMMRRKGSTKHIIKTNKKMTSILDLILINLLPIVNLKVAMEEVMT